MIVTERILIKDKEFLHTYSDIGCFIERNGIQYVDAIDPINSGRTYIETAEFIGGEDAKEEDYIAALAKLGVNE